MKLATASAACTVEMAKSAPTANFCTLRARLDLETTELLLGTMTATTLDALYRESPEASIAREGQ